MCEFGAPWWLQAHTIVPEITQYWLPAGFDLSHRCSLSNTWAVTACKLMLTKGLVSTAGSTGSCSRYLYVIGFPMTIFNMLVTDLNCMSGSWCAPLPITSLSIPYGKKQHNRACMVIPGDRLPQLIYWFLRWNCWTNNPVDQRPRSSHPRAQDNSTAIEMYASNCIRPDLKWSKIVESIFENTLVMHNGQPWVNPWKTPGCGIHTDPY